MDNTISTLVIGSVGLALTYFYSRHTKRLSHEQLLKQLFTEFNNRYDKLNDHLIVIKQNYSSIELLNEAENSDFLKQKVIDYFSLCAEEFFWYHHKKRIDAVIWNSWQNGMNYWYNVPSIKALWEEEVKTNGKGSYYISKDNVGFFKDGENKAN